MVMWMVVMRLVVMRLVALALVGGGVFLIVMGGDQTIVRGMLLAGLFYASLSLLLERRTRRRS